MRIHLMRFPVPFREVRAWDKAVTELPLAPQTMPIDAENITAIAPVFEEIDHTRSGLDSLYIYGYSFKIYPQNR